MGWAKPGTVSASVTKYLVEILQKDSVSLSHGLCIDQKHSVKPTPTVYHTHQFNHICQSSIVSLVIELHAF